MWSAIFGFLREETSFPIGRFSANARHRFFTTGNLRQGAPQTKKQGGKASPYEKYKRPLRRREVKLQVLNFEFLKFYQSEHSSASKW